LDVQAENIEYFEERWVRNSKQELDWQEQNKSKYECIGLIIELTTAAEVVIKYTSE